MLASRTNGTFGFVQHTNQTQTQDSDLLQTHN